MAVFFCSCDALCKEMKNKIYLGEKEVAKTCHAESKCTCVVGAKEKKAGDSPDILESSWAVLKNVIALADGNEIIQLH